MILSSDNIPQVRGHCGTIRKLVSEGPAKLIHLIVDKAEKHYHKKPQNIIMYLMEKDTYLLTIKYNLLRKEM
ncbi:hypothetical protein [Okeania sp.]|uniref:hypothetical protein n=1 Tax=Okeania sp. TaxID=3100323 RepID=UPI002B4B6043|nr:hypothetical protein [Okeania sp.]MEB3342154.1 hypothetical protein [Okeania sp.]